MTVRRLAGLAAGALVALAGGSGLLVPSSAAAAACSSASGVSVVVDFHQLGGGVQQLCDDDGGGSDAADLFVDNGFPLDYVQRQPGFVCRVSGVPAEDPCVSTPPEDAYWGLFWSDGKNGRWTYASSGVGGLTIPEGGYVAFSWQGSDSRQLPGVPPTAHPTTASPSPTRKPSPTRTPSPTATAAPTTAAATATATPTSAAPSATKAPRPTRTRAPKAAGGTSARPSPSARPSAEASDQAETATSTPTSAPTEPESGGVPMRVVLPLLGLVVVGAGATAWRRRSG